MDVAELAAVDELAELAHRRAEHEGVADHEREAGAVGQLHQLLGVGRRAVIGFSTKTCLPASSAALASAKCVEIGVAMTTASTAGSASTSS